MILSSLYFSQSAAHFSQAAAQAAAMNPADGPLRPETFVQALHMSAQSRQVFRQSLTGLPSANRSMQ
jgi:hypothetical protein